MFVVCVQQCPSQPHATHGSSFHHIFSRVGAADRAGQQFLVRASYLEIYNEEIRDLLAKDPKCASRHLHLTLLEPVCVVLYT